MPVTLSLSKGIPLGPKREAIDFNRILALSAIIVLFSGCEPYGTGPSDISVAMKSISDTSCPNLSGRYVFYGKALPGCPSYFGLIGNRVAMDDMLDISLPREQRAMITAAEIIQTDRLEVIFHGQDSIVASRQAVSPENRVGCERGKLTIQRVREGVGEAVTGTATITEMLHKSDEGSLVVKTEILWRNRSFIFWWTSSEEYAARFRPLTSPVH